MAKIIFGVNKIQMAALSVGATPAETVIGETFKLRGICFFDDMVTDKATGEMYEKEVTGLILESEDGERIPISTPSKYVNESANKLINLLSVDEMDGLPVTIKECVSKGKNKFYQLVPVV